jgi:hypothetical protein
VTVGETEVDPEAFVLVIVPGEILTEVALLVVQDKVDDWPEVMEFGLALKELMLGGAGDAAVTVIESDWLALLGLAVTATVKA